MGEPSLRDWLDDAAPPRDDDPAEEPSGGRRRHLWRVAVLAWALVAGAAIVLVRAPAGPAPSAVPASPAAPVPADPAPADPAPSDPTPADPAPADPAPSDPDAMPPAARPAESPAPPGTAGPPGPGVEAQVAAIAAVAVRLALTTDEPGVTRYVDLALPSSAAWHGQVAVVTVDAVLLDGRDGGWEPPRAARFAQAVVAEPGAPPRPLGEPWALPPPPEAEPLELEPFDDAAATRDAGARLAEAGYADVEVTGVARSALAPAVHVVTAVARAPGEATVATHQVWLSAGPAGAGPAGAVLGLPPLTGGPGPPRQEEP